MTATFPSEAEEPARYAWAEHLIWMEGGEPVESGAEEKRWPGLLLALVLAAGAYLVGGAAGKLEMAHAKLLDPVLISMLLGLLAGNLISSAVFLPGVSLAVRQLLPLGIVLLGVRMDFVEALRVGLPGLAMSVAVVALAIGILHFLGSAFGLDRTMAWLLGVGTGICGGTAIVAMAPLLKAKENHVLVGVGLVTLIGLAAMILLPLMSGLMGLSEAQFGLLAGLTIHQTPQVIAAGFAVGDEAGQVATVAKLSRVCLLAPVAILIGWWVSRGRLEKGESNRPWYRLIPGFAIGFLLVACATTLGLFPAITLEWRSAGFHFESDQVLRWISSFLLAAGMVGVGFQTRISQAQEIGWRPALAAVLASLFITIIMVAIVSNFF